MKFLLGLFMALILAGCSEAQWDSLEEYLLSNNDVQEQENSSKKSLLNRLEIDLDKRCIWNDLERVVDGDTLIVRDGVDRIRVRMIGIDTPESKKEGTPIERLSLEAGDKLKELLEGESRVCLVEDLVGDKYDVYGRKLAYVFTDEDLDLNAEMLNLGLARAYTRFDFERKKEFIELEDRAKSVKVGLWE